MFLGKTGPLGPLNFKRFYYPLAIRAWLASASFRRKSLKVLPFRSAAERDGMLTCETKLGVFSTVRDSPAKTVPVQTMAQLSTLNHPSMNPQNTEIKVLICKNTCCRSICKRWRIWSGRGLSWRRIKSKSIGYHPLRESEMDR